jgi:hypothetical protein
MIAKNYNEAKLILESLSEDAFPLAIYSSTVTYYEMEKLFDTAKGNFSEVPTDELVYAKSRMIYLLNKFVEEVGSSVRNAEMSYASRKIKRAREYEKLVKETSATAANNIVDGKIQEVLDNLAERESLRDTLKMKYNIYIEFIRDLSQQISLRRKELDVGIGD